MKQPIHKRAIAKAGGPAKVAVLLGITSQAVSQWQRVPVVHAGKLSRETGIPLWELRPDIFGPRP